MEATARSAAGRLSLAVAGIAACAAAVQAQSFVDLLGTTAKTRPIAAALARAIVRAVPLTAGSPGIVREYSMHTEAEEQSLFGQILLERPETVGPHDGYLVASWRFVRLATLDGLDLDELRDVWPPICASRGCRRIPYTVPAYHLDVATNEIEVGGTYGLPAWLLEDAEVGLTVPVLASEIHGRVTLRDLGAVPGAGRIFSDQAPQGSAAGIGDLLLRGKKRLGGTRWLTVAAGLLVRVPTGDEDDLQGTGHVGVSPMVYAAGDRMAVWDDMLVRPYANLAVDIDATDPSATEVRWGLGLDVQPHRRVVFEAGFVARHAFEPFGPEGALDVLRCTGDRSVCLQENPPTATAPLFGIDGGGRDLYDLSLGVRAVVWVPRIVLTAHVILPLNSAGVRAAPIPLVGIEVPFVSPRRDPGFPP